MFINKHLKFGSICTIFENNNTAPNPPLIMQPPLKMFNQIFLSLQTDIPKKRVKRGSFNRFFEYVFGDADLRLRNLETFSRQELQMVNLLIDKSNSTDLAIKHDETIIANLFQDTHMEQLRLKIDLQQLSRNQHIPFQLSLNRLQNFHTIY